MAVKEAAVMQTQDSPLASNNTTQNTQDDNQYIEEAKVTYKLMMNLNSGDIVAAKALYDRFAEFKKSAPDNQEIAIFEALSTFTLIASFGDNGDLATAKAIYNRFSELRKVAPDSEEMASIEEEARTKLIEVYKSAGRLEDAEALSRRS